MLTSNQKLYLQIASRNPNQWVDIIRVCLVGRFDARGRKFVLESLKKRGLILERWAPSAHNSDGIKYRSESLSIKITQAGIDALSDAACREAVTE